MTDRLPEHVAIIMDGNGRWAQANGKARFSGHRVGAKTTFNIIEASQQLGIKVLSLYAFSTENFNRPSTEVKFLHSLMAVSLRIHVRKLIKEGVVVKVIGDRSRLPRFLASHIERVEQLTAHNTGMVLQLCMSYSGRYDIVNATKLIAQKVLAGEVQVEDIDEALIGSQMQSHPLADPDLLIRTGNETRISNYFLWQAAYSEFYFTEKMWPEFSVEDYKEALATYANRTRRFGKTNEQVK